MDNHDAASSSRLRDSSMTTGLKKLGLDKLFKKKKPGPEPAPEPEPTMFPPPSFLRPTKVRMLARDDISIAVSGRRTRSLPETPATVAQVSSGSVSGSNEPPMSTGRSTHPTYSPFPRVPQRSTSLAPLRRGSSLAGMLEFSFGNDRASSAGPRNSPMPSPRTRSRSGSESPTQPLSASATQSKQPDGDIEASVCPLQKLDDDGEASVCPLQKALSAALPVALSAALPSAIPVAIPAALPAPTAALPPPPADGLLTPPLSAQQDNFAAATLPHDKHLSFAPLNIPTPETSPFLIPQPESSLEEPKIEQTISPQSRRGSDSDLATLEAAHDPEDSPKDTPSTFTPKERKRAALKESIGSLADLLRRECASPRDHQGDAQIDSASASSDLEGDAQIDPASTSSGLQGDVPADLVSAAPEGKGKGVIQELDPENLDSSSDNESKNLISLSDSGSDNVGSQSIQGEAPFAAASKAAEDTGKAMPKELDLISQDIQEDVSFAATSKGPEDKGKAVLKELDLENPISPSDNEVDNVLFQDLLGDVPFAATSKAAQDKGNLAVLRELDLEIPLSPIDNEIGSTSNEAIKEFGKKIMSALWEPSLGDFFTMTDDEISEDDDSTKAQPPSRAQSIIMPQPPSRRMLPAALPTANPPRGSDGRVIIPPPPRHRLLPAAMVAAHPLRGPDGRIIAPQPPRRSASISPSGEPERRIVIAQAPRRAVTINPSRGTDRRIILSPPLASQPAAEAAMAAAKIAHRFGFDVVYVVNLWPANIGLSQLESLPMATAGGSQERTISKKASSSSLATLATVIHRPSAPAKLEADKGGRSDCRLTGRLLAGHGLQHVAAPFSIPELMHRQVLRAEDWLEYRSSDPSNPDLFSRGYMCSFYTGSSAAVASPGPEINRGIVFAAYRLQREDGIVVESYRDELSGVRKDAQNLVDMVINSSTTPRQRT